MNEARHRRYVVLAYLVIALAVFGRSLSYGFVYDDHMRVQFNPSITSLSRAMRSFWDRSAQAGTTDLQRDNYRPLITLNYAADYAVWKLRPGFYRLENIAIHAANATLVAGLAELLMGLSAGAAFLAGLAFLLHPLQTEGVVWIASRSDIVATFFALICFTAWERYRGTNRRRALVNAYLSFVFSLLSRETAVVIPVVLMLNDGLRSRTDGRRIAWRPVAIFSALAGAFIGVRYLVLGQTAQSVFWGGTFVSNLANVARVWPLYLGKILWPARLRATYTDLDVVSALTDPAAIAGLMCLMVWIAAACAALRRAPRVAYVLILFLVLWLPGSNLVPLTTLFAERLVYPLMIAVAFMMGGAVDAAREKMKTTAAPVALCGGILLTWAGLAFRQTATWKNDRALWTQATQVAPRSWFGWNSLALVDVNDAVIARRGGDVPAARRLLASAEDSFIAALKERPPVDAGGRMFLDLSRVCHAEGKDDAAREYARRAAALGFPSGT